MPSRCRRPIPLPRDQAAAVTRRSVLVLALAASPAAAQTVGGYVHEQGTGVAVAGATVALRQLGGAVRLAAPTDSGGVFLLRAGKPGRYELAVLHPGFLGFQDTLQLRADESLRLRIQLGRDAIPLEPLVVTARVQRRLQGFYERVNRGGGVGRILTRTDLEAMVANRTSDYLRRVPGVRLERVDGGSLVVLNNPLGRCTPLLYIDGIPVEQRTPDQVDVLLQPSMLEGIEVYSGTVGIPLELASAQQTGCGVVAFWTREPTGRQLSWMRLVLSFAAVGAFILTSWSVLL